MAGDCPMAIIMGYSVLTSPPISDVSRAGEGGRATFGRFAEETTQPMTLLLAAVGAVVTAPTRRRLLGQAAGLAGAALAPAGWTARTVNAMVVRRMLVTRMCRRPSKADFW